MAVPIEAAPAKPRGLPRQLVEHQRLTLLVNQLLKVLDQQVASRQHATQLRAPQMFTNRAASSSASVKVLSRAKTAASIRCRSARRLILSQSRNAREKSIM